PAIVPNTSFSSYPRFCSSGRATLVTVAQVAADEPLTAAKTPQARTGTWLRRPGIRRIHGDIPLKRSSETRLRNRISPIHMNRGSAASDHAADEDHRFEASARSMGAVENTSTPTMPERNSATATHTPSASEPSSVRTMRKIPMASFTCFPLLTASRYEWARDP